MDKYDLGRDIIKQYQALKSIRMPYEGTWDDITDLVVPNRSKFIDTAVDYEPNTEVYDSTATQSAEYLTATLLNGLVNPETKWFDLVFKDRELNNTFEAKLDLEKRVNITYDLLNSSSSGFFSNISEMILDLVAYGTAGMEVFYEAGQGIKFRAIHLSQLYIAADKSGKIDTVYRKFRFTARQAAQTWGLEALPNHMREAIEEEPHKRFEIIRCVRPEESYSKKNRTKKPYHSSYVCVESQEIISEGGLKYFPYVIPRWTKLTDQDYGRSPAWSALPDIFTVQGMEMSLMIAGQKQADPPLLVADDGVMPNISADAGSLIYGGIDPIAGNNRIQALDTRANMAVFEALLERKREAIRRAFYNNALSMQNLPRMTAEEVITRREEDFRLLSPNANRIIQEALEPLIWTTFALMREHGYFPDPVEASIGQELEIKMMSPLAKTARMQEVGAFSRLLNQTVVPLAQLDQTVLDKINVDRAFEEAADSLGVPLNMLATPQEYEAKQLQRQQEQQMQMQMQLAAQADQAETARAAATPNQEQEIPNEPEL